jgi:adenine-specific DNA-methyltransferase
MTGESLDIKSAELEKLYSLFPGVFTEGKLDWEKLKATFGDSIHFSNERYVLNWAGKADAYKVLQTPTTATLKPCPEESINFDTSENIFIEGENLEVLKILQKSYFGKIKVICIDPPYNTGNDSFVYPDKFSERKEDYLKRVGDKNEEGFLMKEGLFRKNSKDSGHFHSNWLSMMFPRLFLARNLLRDDGVIFIHIDDNEVHNLRLLMNEIFGEENFVAQIVWEKRYGRSNDVKLFSSVTDYIIAFRKSEKLNTIREPRNDSNNDIYSNPDNDPRGVWTSVSFVSQRTKEERRNLSYPIINPNTGESFEHPVNAWKFSYDKFIELQADNRFYWGKDGTQKQPRIKRFLSELGDKLVPVNLWKHQEVGTGEVGTKEVDNLLGKEVFTYPKPTSLLKKILNIGSQKDSLILDFFAGSSSLAQAVLELNKEDGGDRKFILVQLSELCDESSEAYKAGYKTIAEISKERIRRSIRKIESENTNQQDLFKQNSASLPLGFRVFKLSDSNFKIWNTQSKSSNELITQLDAFTDPVSTTSDNENMIYELLLKSGYALTEEVVKQEGYYVVKNKGLIIILEHINNDIIISALAENPLKIICLDRAFAGNDQLKTNTILQLKEAGIDFKII